jgi:hypothetical protein
MHDADPVEAKEEILISNTLNPWMHLSQDILENKVAIEDLMFEVLKD